MMRSLIKIILFSVLPLQGISQNISEIAQTHLKNGLDIAASAQSNDDYLAAIHEFQIALKFAPAWPDPAYNLGVLEEKVGQYDSALIHLRLYLDLTPGAEDAEEVKALIAKTEIKLEKLQAAKERASALVGTWVAYWKVDNELYDTYSFLLKDGGFEITRSPGSFTSQTTIVEFDGEDIYIKHLFQTLNGSLAIEYEIIAKWVSPVKIEGVITTTWLKLPESWTTGQAGDKISNQVYLIKR